MDRRSFLKTTAVAAETPTLTGGGTRAFLEDGDRVTLRGHAQGDGFRVGFGACSGIVRGARA